MDSSISVTDVPVHIWAFAHLWMGLYPSINCACPSTNWHFWQVGIAYKVHMVLTGTSDRHGLPDAERRRMDLWRRTESRQVSVSGGFNMNRFYVIRLSFTMGIVVKWLAGEKDRRYISTYVRRTGVKASQSPLRHQRNKQPERMEPVHAWVQARSCSGTRSCTGLNRTWTGNFHVLVLTYLP